MGKKDKKQLAEDSESPVDSIPNEMKEKENFYVFDSSLKTIFQSGASSTFTISGILDSSGDKSEAEKKDVNKEDSKENASESNIEKKQELPKKVASWKEHFFFLPDDPRFAAGIQFFSSSKTPTNGAFSDLRKNLKGLVRHKISKNKTLKIKRKFGKNKRRKNRSIKGI